MTEFSVGDIVKLKNSASEYHRGLKIDINKFHYIILARNNRINYDVLHVHTLTKHYAVNMDEYELA